MEIRRFTSRANDKEVLKVSDSGATLFIPTSVPREVIKHFARRLCYHRERRHAHQRREAREALKYKARYRRGRIRLKRHVRVRLRRRIARFWPVSRPLSHRRRLTHLRPRRHLYR